MSDPCKDYDILKPEGFWLLENGREIAEQVKLVLNTTNISEAAISKSLEWVKPHTWDNRAKQIVAWHERNYATAKVS